MNANSMAPIAMKYLGLGFVITEVTHKNAATIVMNTGITTGT